VTGREAEKEAIWGCGGARTEEPSHMAGLGGGREAKKKEPLGWPSRSWRVEPATVHKAVHSVSVWGFNCGAWTLHGDFSGRSLHMPNWFGGYSQSVGRPAKQSRRGDRLVTPLRRSLCTARRGRVHGAPAACSQRVYFWLCTPVEEPFRLSAHWASVFGPPGARAHPDDQI
jgi:hypothetical protein